MDIMLLAKHFVDRPNNCSVSTVRTLGEKVTEDDLDGGLIYPPFRNIRKISAVIAAGVSGTAYDLGTKREKHCCALIIKLVL